MRKPKPEDTAWIIEAYADYPPTAKNGGLIAPTDVRDWVRRWMHRTDEICLINDAGCCLITFRQDPEHEKGVIVDQILTHPDYRRAGHANGLMAELTEYLVAEGFEKASFDTLPGPIRNKYPDGVVTAWS